MQEQKVEEGVAQLTSFCLMRRSGVNPSILPEPASQLPGSYPNFI